MTPLFGIEITYPDRGKLVPTSSGSSTGGRLISIV